MKYGFLLCNFLLMVSLVFGAEVPKKNAGELAGTFLKSVRGFHPGPVTDHHLISKEGCALYHVVNFSEGFVLVSADDRFYPVLAFSDHGNYSADEMPEHVAAWMDWYAKQMLVALKGRMDFFECIAFNPQDFSREKMVEPLLSSKWGQGRYYNILCPEDSSSAYNRVPAGCVPVAMAQILFYYRYPPWGNGSHSYLPGYGNGMYGIQSADFGNTQYRWEEMQDFIDGPNDAVAQLIYHTGVAVNTNYSPTGSGANTLMVPGAFSDYFNYLPGAQNLSRADYDTLNIWQEMLMENLDNKMPVLYRSMAFPFGHAYVCDGYADGSHFHFNWGWDGRYDGYYYIDELIPGGINLSDNQGGIFGLFPDTTAFQYPPGCQLADTLTHHEGSVADGSGIFDYLPHQECSWLVNIDSAEISHVIISFSDFSLAAGDVLEIYRGTSVADPLIAALNGNEIPGMLTVDGKECLIRFVSDDAWEGEGFLLNYWGVKMPFCQEEAVVLADVEGSLEDGSGYFPYGNHSDCRWLIAPEAPPGDSVEYVVVEFSLLDLADDDTLWFFDGETENAPVLDSFTRGEIPDSFSSSEDKLFVKFTSDDSLTAQGWRFSWTSVAPVYCHDTVWLDQPSGSFSDGSNDKFYLNNSECYWVLDVPESQIIKVWFEKFDLEYQYDFLKVFDMNQQPTKLLQVYTGSVLPDPQIFQSNRLLFAFTSDDFLVKDGFDLSYTEIEMPDYCHDTVYLSQSHGTITDGSHDENYLNNSRCVWMVDVSEHFSLNITFSLLDLEYQYDFLYVYDATMQPPVLLKNFSGSAIPPPFLLESNRLIFVFESDENITRDGFVLNYEAKPDAIGEKQHAVWQLFPNPVGDFLSIQGYCTEEAKWVISDLSGRIIRSGKYEGSSCQINTSALEPGIYLLRICCSSNTHFQKFVKSSSYLIK
ncbi:MAG: CUB domain-containing protein [Bacteroidales bacterium]